jgi:hypothetical protein
MKSAAIGALVVAVGLGSTSGASAQTHERLPAAERYTVRVEYSELRPTLTGKAAKGNNGQAGTLIDLVDDLGIAKKRTFEVRGALKIGSATKIRASWVPINVKGDLFANSTFRFGATRFARFSEVVTTVKGNYFSAAYEWDFMRSPHGLLGLLLGGRMVDVDYVVVAPGQGEREQDTLRKPLPVGGLTGRYYAGKLSFSGELSMLPAGDRGSFYEGETAARLHLSDRLAVGGGYRFFSLRGKEQVDQLNAHFSGWQFGLELSL